MRLGVGPVGQGGTLEEQAGKVGVGHEAQHAPGFGLQQHGQQGRFTGGILKSLPEWVRDFLHEGVTPIRVPVQPGVDQSGNPFALRQVNQYSRVGIRCTWTANALAGEGDSSTRCVMGSSGRLPQLFNVPQHWHHFRQRASFALAGMAATRQHRHESLCIRLDTQHRFNSPVW